MLHPAIRQQVSAIHGLGLFAVEFIPKGTVIWTADAQDQHLTMEAFLALPQNLRHLCHLGPDGFVLSRDGSEVMNHSCDPNTACLGDDKLVTIRDVQPGEEVTYDYATDYATTERDVSLWYDWPCGCGAANCRGVISMTDCLDPAFQQRYAGHLPSWTLAFIEAQQKAAVSAEGDS